MLIETRAIVLHRSAYNDRYSIVHLYTEQYGRLGILTSATRSRKGNAVRHQALSPLSEIEFIGELKAGKGLATIKELHLYRPNHQIQLNPIKCSQGLFISELLYRVLSGDMPEPQLYHFIADSLYFFHTASEGLANFYLCFSYHLLHYLAIEPSVDPTDIGFGRWYDLKEAQFTTEPNLTSNTAIPPSHTYYMYLFTRMTYANMHRFRYNREQRAIIIDYLLLYYRLHLPAFPHIKSLDILRGAGQTIRNTQDK